jgi:hypothetical protein
LPKTLNSCISPSYPFFNSVLSDSVVLFSDHVPPKHLILFEKSTWLLLFPALYQPVFQQRPRAPVSHVLGNFPLVRVCIAPDQIPIDLHKPK